MSTLPGYGLRASKAAKDWEDHYCRFSNVRPLSPGDGVEASAPLVRCRADRDTDARTGDVSPLVAPVKH